MNPTIQPGMHPDAETLTAFAELSLLANEREQVLAHIAVCSRCREVVFLVQQAATEEPMKASSPAVSRTARSRGWGAAGWRWVSVPAAVLAGLIGVAILLHVRGAKTETEMARNMAAKDSLEPASPQPPRVNSKPLTKPETKLERSKPQALRSHSVARQNEESDQKQEQPRIKAPSMGMTSGLAGGSMHGSMSARTQSTPFDGPTSNPLPQNSVPLENPVQQNPTMLQSTESINKTPAGKAAIGGVSYASAAGPVPQPKPAAAKTSASAPPARLSTFPTNQSTFRISAGAMAEMRKAAKMTLPSGVQPLSVTSAAGRTLAIDSFGSLFLSEDHGRHWQSVATQWTGRAVLVRNISNQNLKDDVQPAPALRFELVNDSSETWMSPDGKTWNAETLPNR